MAIKIGGVRTLIRQARNRIFPGALILLYHRVDEPELDPQLLSVSRRNFEEHMQVLQKFHPTSLESLQSTTSSRRDRIAVTFDDGYADNLWNGKPLLVKYAIPATVFVSSGYVLNQRPYWWDELEQLLLKPNPLPETLSVDIGGKRRDWFLGNLDAYLESYPRNLEWNVLAASDPSLRHTAYRQLCTEIKALAPDQREKVLGEVRSATAINSDYPSGVCTPEEIRRLREPGLIDIGGHTCTHPVLSQLNVHKQQQEISRGKEMLEEIIDNPIKAFAYPFGTQGDYSPSTVECVRRSGFERACSNFEGHVRGSTDSYQLPRYLVRNWDGETFMRQLNMWFHD